MKNLVSRICITGTGVLLLSFLGGCTTSGEHISAYKNLRTELYYSNTFRIPSEGREIVYVGVRDLSGVSLENNLKAAFVNTFGSVPHFLITDDPQKATMRVYATIHPVQGDSNNAQGGVATGAAVGAVTGSIMAASSHRYYWRPEGDIFVLMMGLLGAVIGYAIEDNIRIDTVQMTTDLEIEHGAYNSNDSYTSLDGSNGYQTYKITITCQGKQLNMDYPAAVTTLLNKTAQGAAGLMSFQ